MLRRIVSCGNCLPDHVALARFLQTHFSCEVIDTKGLEDTLAAISTAPTDLVLVNRKLDADYSDGITIIEAIKANAETARIPCMLVTNLHEHQDEAEKAGALRGFGKLELNNQATLERLTPVLT